MTADDGTRTTPTKIFEKVKETINKYPTSSDLPFEERMLYRRVKAALNGVKNETSEEAFNESEMLKHTQVEKIGPWLERLAEVVTKRNVCVG